MPAAGKGTRLIPLTGRTSKEALPIGCKPMIEYSLEELGRAGIADVGIVLNKKKKDLRKYLAFLPLKLKKNLQISFMYQTEPLGLADALCRAKRFVGQEPFAVVLPDNIFFSKVPAIQQLVKPFQKYALSVIGLIRVSRAEAERFGNCGLVRGQLLEKGIWRLTALSDKGPGSLKIEGETALRTFGRSIFSPALFQHVEVVRPAAKGELDDVPVMQEMIKNGKLLGCLLDGKGFDAGNMPGYGAALLHAARKLK